MNNDDERDYAEEAYNRALMHDESERLCEWFLLCDHPATGTRSHPILGAVPICDRCAERLS